MLAVGLLVVVLLTSMALSFRYWYACVQKLFLENERLGRAVPESVEQKPLKQQSESAKPDEATVPDVPNLPVTPVPVSVPVPSQLDMPVTPVAGATARVVSQVVSATGERVQRMTPIYKGGDRYRMVRVGGTKEIEDACNDVFMKVARPKSASVGGRGPVRAGLRMRSLDEARKSVQRYSGDSEEYASNEGIGF